MSIIPSTIGYTELNEVMNSSLFFDIVEGVITYSCMLIVVITLPIYCVVVFVLFSSRNYHSTKNVFFRIYLIGGIIDIANIANNYLGAIFPGRGWCLWYYLSSPWTGEIYLIFAWSTRVCQACTVLLLAINRTTAVVKPTKYSQIWSGRFSVIVWFLQLGPGTMMGALILYSSYYWIQKDNGGWYIQFADGDFRLHYFTLAFILQLFFVVTIMGNYVVVMMYFRLKYNLTSAPSDQRARAVFFEKQKQERRLLYLSLIVCTLEVIFFFFSVYFFVINTTVPTRIFYLVYNALSDIYAVTPAYLLILFSTAFKRRLCVFLGLARDPLAPTHISVVDYNKNTTKTTRSKLSRRPTLTLA